VILAYREAEMSLFEDIIERKNRKWKEANNKYLREKEVEKIFYKLCKQHERELKRHFSRVKIHSDSLSVDSYNIVFGTLNTCLYIGYCANSIGGEIKIDFDYSWTDVKLILTFNNALRVLVSIAYRPYASLVKAD
jgi:hypothetical protein